MSRQCLWYFSFSPEIFAARLVSHIFQAEIKIIKLTLRRQDGVIVVVIFNIDISILAISDP